LLEGGGLKQRGISADQVQVVAQESRSPENRALGLALLPPVAHQSECVLRGQVSEIVEANTASLKAGDGALQHLSDLEAMPALVLMFAVHDRVLEKEGNLKARVAAAARLQVLEEPNVEIRSVGRWRILGARGLAAGWSVSSPDGPVCRAYCCGLSAHEISK